MGVGMDFYMQSRGCVVFFSSSLSFISNGWCWPGDGVISIEDNDTCWKQEVGKR